MKKIFDLLYWQPKDWQKLLLGFLAIVLLASISIHVFEVTPKWLLDIGGNIFYIIIVFLLVLIVAASLFEGKY